MDLIFYLTRSAPAGDSVFPESTLVPSYFLLSGCELIDTENICLPSQNMKFGGESFSFRKIEKVSFKHRKRQFIVFQVI
jgi:hypothetical protein